MAKTSENVAAIVTTETNGPESRLSLLKSRLSVAKAWAKKPHKEMRKYIAEYEIEDIKDTDEIRDKVRIGYIFRKAETELPAIFDDQPDLFIKGRNEELKKLEGLFDGLYDYLWDVQNLEEKVEDAGLYFTLLGMAFVESPWVTKNKKVKEMQPVPFMMSDGTPVLDQNGQPAVTQQEVEYEVPEVDNPVANVLDPFKVFFSPETIFAPILDYAHCPYYFIEETKTKENIKAEYGKDVEVSEQLHTNNSDVDEEIDEVPAENKDDLKRAKVYRYVGCLPENLAKDILDEDDKASEWTYDKDYEVVFTSDTELSAKELEYPHKPLFVIGNYGLANKFWRFGDARHLLPLVQELEKYRAQILKHTRKMANPKPLIEVGSDVDEAAFRDPNVGSTVKYKGVAPAYLSPANLGREVEVGVDMVRTDLEKTAPSFDLNNGGGSSQVKTPRGIQVYSEASDRGVRRKRKKFARFIRQIMIFQFMQVAMNWKPEDMKKIEVNGQEETMSAEVLQVLGDTNILNKLDIEIESLTVNKVQMKQDALEFFDIAAKYPQVFNLMECAKDLVQNGFGKRDADRYLISQQQIEEQTIQRFIASLAQMNPELAGVVAQYKQNPNLMQLMDQSAGQSSDPKADQQPPQQDMPQMPTIGQ